jgi:hypothetical protein
VEMAAAPPSATPSRTASGGADVDGGAVRWGADVDGGAASDGERM